MWLICAMLTIAQTSAGAMSATDLAGKKARQWLRAAQPGHCGETKGHEEWHDARSCACEHSGSWKLPADVKRAGMEASVAWCLEQCTTCTNCRHASISLINSDCSWHAHCHRRVSLADFVSGPQLLSRGGAYRATTLGAPPLQLPTDCAPVGHNVTGMLDRATHRRAVTRIAPPAATDTLFRRLSQGLPVRVGVLGASVAQNGGCLTQPGKRCMQYAHTAANKAANGPGFAVRFFEHLNVSFPHVGHALHNGGADATAPQHMVRCLLSHLPPPVHMVVIELGSMAQYQEHVAIEALVRALLSLTPQPLLVLLSVRKMCVHPRGANEGRLPTRAKQRGFNETHWGKSEQAAEQACERYGAACLSVGRALLPLVAARRAGFELADVVQPDCLHIAKSRHGPSYVASLLTHWFQSAHARWRVWASTHEGSDAPRETRLPPPSSATVDTLLRPSRCYAFSPNGGRHAGEAAEGEVSANDGGPKERGRPSESWLSNQQWVTVRWESAGCDAPRHGHAAAGSGSGMRCGAFGVAVCPRAMQHSSAAYDHFITSPPRGWVFCRFSLSPGNRKVSPGLVALVPGATLRASLPAAEFPSAHHSGSGRGAAFEIAITYLRSYAGGMGMVHLSCQGYCACTEERIDAHEQKGHNSVFAEHVVRATLPMMSRAALAAGSGHAAVPCTLQLLVLNETSSGGHKFKFKSLRVEAARQQ